MIDLSILIACYNGESTLGETLEGLVSQEWRRPWEIILCNNRSTDRSVALFEDYARRHPAIPMCVVDASARRGKAHALNRGMAAARGRAIAFCDADDVVAPGWLRAMGDALDSKPFVAARMDFTVLNTGWVRHYRGHAQETRLPQTPWAPHFNYAGGGTFAFTRAVFETVGGFDEDLLYLEDNDFCIRAQLRGHALSYVPEAVIHIRSRADVRKVYEQSYSWARAEIGLYKRYGRRTSLPISLYRLAKAWGVIAIRAAQRAIVGPRYSDVLEARFQWKLGQARGRLAGAIEHRVAPF